MRWISWYQAHGHTNDALETAFPDDTHVFLRSSMNPRDSITIDVDAWRQFIYAVKRGYFDSYISDGVSQEMMQSEGNDNASSSHH